MDVYKHFLAGVSNVSMQSVYIIVRELLSVSPRLLNYVKSLTKIKYEDGKLHIFFWEVKNLICSFVLFWTSTMDDAMKEGDRMAHSGMDKDTLLKHIDKTIKFRERLGENFDRDFLPIRTQKEQEVYDEVTKANDVYLKQLHNLRAKVEKYDKQEYVDEFARREFPKSVKMKNNAFRYTHTYIAMLLADRLPEIRGSLEDTVQQLHRNIKAKRSEDEEEFNALLNLLYEKNKELLMLQRQVLHHTTDTVELKIVIEKLRKRVAEKRDRKSIETLVQEAEYFEKVLSEFNQISATLIKLKAKLEGVGRELALHKSRRTTELPGSKFDRWHEMGETFEKQSAMLKEQLIKAAKSLVTFFCVKGADSAVYNNYEGPYHVDDYGHQVYHWEFCLKMFHLDCDGAFRETLGSNRYFYDDKGRYFLDGNGEKVYQTLECTSIYKIGEDTLMKKITKDCGHSEAPNKDCGIYMKVPNVEILPKTEPVNITQTLKPEITRYLWDAMGAILPDALYDVAMLQPKNPIHYLAHRLLAHKYGKTKGELLEKKEKAEAYRAKMIEEHKEAEANKHLELRDVKPHSSLPHACESHDMRKKLQQDKTECRAWKAKQFLRSKHGDVDDAQQAVFDRYRVANELIRTIDSYN